MDRPLPRRLSKFRHRSPCVFGHFSLRGQPPSKSSTIVAETTAVGFVDSDDSRIVSMTYTPAFPVRGTPAATVPSRVQLGRSAREGTMAIEKRIRTLGALVLLLGLAVGCAYTTGADPRDGTGVGNGVVGGGDGTYWNGESGRIALLRARATLLGMQSMAARILAQGPGSTSFFGRDNCDSSNVNCLALQSLSDADYAELVKFAKSSLTQIVGFSNASPTVTIDVARAPLYPGPGAPPEMQGIEMYAMANFTTKTILIAPTAAAIDEQYFGMLFAHEIGHLVRLEDSNGQLTQSHYGYDHENFLTAYAAGIMLAIGDKPPPFDFDTSLNYRGAEAATCKNGRLCVGVPGQSTLTGMALQADGKIVVAGTSVDALNRGSLFVARFTPDGKPDTSFSGDGVAVVRNADDSTGGGPIAVLPNGNVIVFGHVQQGRSVRLAFYLLDGNGNRVPGYGNNSGFLVEPDFHPTREDGRALPVYYVNRVTTTLSTGGGRTLVGGSTCRAANGNTYCSPLLIRVNGQGQFDGTFGNTRWRQGGGVAEVPEASYGSYCVLHDLATDASGRIVATGGRGSSHASLLLRWSAAGQADRNFGGTDGWAGSGSLLSRNQTAVVTERGILVAGNVSAIAAAMRFNDDATASDPTFGTGGTAGRASLGVHSNVFKALPYSRGRALLAVQRPSSTTAAFALIDSMGRLLPFVPTTNVSNAVREVAFPWIAYPEFMLLQPTNGMVLVGGTANIRGVRTPFVARFWPPWE